MPGSLRGSRDVIRQSMEQAFAGPLKGSSTRNKQLGIRPVGRDAAIVISEAKRSAAGNRADVALGRLGRVGE